MRIKQLVLAAVAAALVATVGDTREIPPVDMAFGYSSMFIGQGYTFWMQGGDASVAFALSERFRLVGDFAAHQAHPGVELNTQTYMVGPRLYLLEWGRFRPFAHVLVGGLHASAVTTGFTNASDAFAYGAGAGADVGSGWGRNFAIRPQLEWVGFRAKGSTTGVARASLNFVYRLEKSSRP